MKQTKHIPIATSVTFVALFATPAVAAAAVDEFRTKVEKWVETRQILSAEQSDWALERETLGATVELLQQEREALRAEIEELETSNTEADGERNELLLRRGAYQRANAALEHEVREMETAVLALARRLPEPLQKKLELLLVQIPEDPERSAPPLGQRLMSVLGVLAQAEKFNNTATFVGETRAVNGGPKVQVRTLYWGLGQAIYVDAQGHSAGVGRPGASGWEFTNDPGLADDAKRLIDIYEGNVDLIEFVDLPVELN